MNNEKRRKKKDEKIFLRDRAERWRKKSTENKFKKKIVPERKKEKKKCEIEWFYSHWENNIYIGNKNDGKKKELKYIIVKEEH